MTIQTTPTAAASAATIARIVEEDALAAARGWAFKEPTLYAWGTELAESGKNAVREHRAELVSRPLVAGLVREADAIAAREQRLDYKVQIPSLRMTDEGRIASKAGSPGAPISRWALGQLFQRAGMPGGSVSYLSSCPAPLRATNVNHWLPRATNLIYPRNGHAAESPLPKVASVEAVLRTRLEGSERGISACVSPRYSKYDLPEVVRDIAGLVEPTGRCALRYDGTRWSLDITFASPHELAVGDLSHGFVRVSGADDGSAPITFASGLFRIRCLNASLIPATREVDAAGVRHSRKDMQAEVAKAFGAAYGGIGEFAALWAKAGEEIVLESVYSGAEPAEVLGALARSGYVSLPGVDEATMTERLVTAWRQEPGWTKASLLNAITRAAHTNAWASPWAVDELEAAAGQLVYVQQLRVVPSGSDTAGAKFELEVN